MSFSKKIIAGVAAVATLAALAPAVAMAEGDQSQNSAASAQSDSTIVNVSFYAANGTLLQSTGWPKGTAFSMYALGVQAPTIEGKTFTGWADSEGTMLKDTDQVSTNIAVHATYADTPAQDDTTQYTVSFYAGTDQLIQTVSYYAKDKVKFSTYAAGIQAPAVEGKTFTGWGFASNDGNVAVNPNAEVTGNWAVYAMYKDTPTSEDKTLNTVSFYNTKNELIQTVSYYAKDKVKFSTYAAGIQAPAVEGKTFTGWGFASNDGDVAVDPNAEVTGNWAVYPMYKNAEKKDDTTQNVVSFYAGTDKLIQTVGYYAKDHVKFSTYAAGIQAPAVEGKIFTGWGFASNDGDVPVDPDMVVTGNWAVYAMYKDAPTEDDTTQNVVSFYAGTDKLIQTVGYYAKDHVKFSTYAAGIQAPAVEGKIFTGWGFASNDGDVPVDPDMVVTGNWAVYAMYKDAPTEDDTTQNVVSFYAGTDKLIQTVGYYAKDHVKFSTYAAGIQAPAVEGKIFTGWGFASNDGDVPVDPDAEVTGNWAVYAMYKDAPTEDDTTQNVVSFYAGTDKLIQTVGYYAKDHVKFSTYAAGIQAPAVEGKIFTGWGFASNDGDVPVDPDAEVTGNWAVYAMYKDAPTEDDTTQNVVSFYAGTDKLIQTVGYYAKDKVKFSQYALGIQAPAVEGKIFTGWGFASNDGDVPVDPDMVVTGDWAVYAMYKDAPTDDSKKDDSKPADTTKKNDTKGNTKKTVAQKIKKAVLGNTGATVGGVAVFAVIALLGFAGITVLRKRA
ncbi:InlB B-repeat-containing protein [Bifidobacterium pseudocatenulatum]|uniref:InlB B-repeat-containing protein n=5 Tax=Bifidobacterium pseudocatenulatum TaxID=28026 RepID=UPI0035627175